MPNHLLRLLQSPRGHQDQAEIEKLIDTLLNQLVAAPLFANVGRPVIDPSVETVVSWKSCLKSMNGRQFVNLGTRMMNRVFGTASEIKGAEWFNRNWNKMADAQKKLIDSRLGDTINSVMKRNKLPDSFMYCVTGDVLIAMFLLQFEDRASLSWSDLSIKWLLSGHVPCGFSGKLPRATSNDSDPLPVPNEQNKLIVF